ncbi:MAG: hypothetical protein KDK28_20095 [Maritimibacter sp.]|nr:hypothetical protein [Maritimibacter sp.]
MLTKLKSVCGVAALAVAATALPAAAHHSAAMFNHEELVEVDGVVKEFQYTNPHSWLIVEVTAEDGSTTLWGFEAEGPSTLMRAGIRKSMLPPGTAIHLRGNPMRDGRPAAAWVDGTLEDGTVINPRNGFAVIPAGSE